MYKYALQEKMTGFKVDLLDRVGVKLVRLECALVTAKGCVYCSDARGGIIRIEQI